MPKWILYLHCSNSGKKTTPKNIKYSTNETMLEIGLLAKATALACSKDFAKYSIWAKILNSLKLVKIDSLFTLE